MRMRRWVYVKWVKRVALKECVRNDSAISSKKIFKISFLIKWRCNVAYSPQDSVDEWGRNAHIKKYLDKSRA